MFLSPHFFNGHFMDLIRPSRGKGTFAVCCSSCGYWCAAPSTPITYLMSPVHQKRGRNTGRKELQGFYQPLKETGDIYCIYKFEGKKLKWNSTIRKRKTFHRKCALSKK